MLWNSHNSLTARRHNAIAGLTIRHGINTSTIANNTATALGDGLYKGALATVTSFHSIIANNLAQNCATNAGNVLNTSNYSLFSDNSCTFSAGTNNLANTAPLLGPLQNNGGPTETHALLVLSTAIDSGDTTCGVITDQRGEPRPVNIIGVSPIDTQTRCDIGALILILIHIFFVDRFWRHAIDFSQQQTTYFIAGEIRCIFEAIMKH